MNSDHSTIAQGAAAQLEHAGDRLLGGLLRILLALLLATAAAQLMRHRRLHWSWAAVAFVALAWLGVRLDGSAWLLAAVALLATLKARRLHRLDEEAGADLAEHARLRLRPADLLQTAIHSAASRLGGSYATGRRLRTSGTTLGRDERGRPVRVPLASGEGAHHALVVGATGSGKTVTQTLIASAAIDRGWPTVIVDPKGDRSMREQLRLAARTAGLEFLEWTPEGPSVFNPYKRGGESEIADKALSGESFSEPHYLRQSQRYLGHAVRALRAIGAEVSIAAIVASLDPGNLERLARECPAAAADPILDYLDSLSPRQRSELGGVRDRLAILAEADVGRWLDPRDGAGTSFDLLDSIRRHRVVYFALDADSRPLVTQMLGAAIVGDLQTAVSRLQSSPMPALVVIDEFSALSVEQVTRLFGRARSAGVSLLLGTQELADLRLRGGERTLDQVLGNLSVLIAHRQVVPASAELIARLAGTRGAWRVVHRSGGQRTWSRAREPVLDASRVTSLATGWAAVTNLAGGTPTRLLRIEPHERSRRG